MRDRLEREEFPPGRHADVEHEVVGGAVVAWEDEGGDGGADGAVGDADGGGVRVDVDGGEGLLGGGGGGRGGFRGGGEDRREGLRD